MFLVCHKISQDHATKASLILTVEASHCKLPTSQVWWPDALW